MAKILLIFSKIKQIHNPYVEEFKGLTLAKSLFSFQAKSKK